MRNKTILLLCSALLSGSLSLSLLGCGAASPSFQGIEILPEEKELSPAAKDTYAYLLYMQALSDEDEELLLQAAQQMTGGTLPAKAWLEGALWLDSRRSEKVLPLLELGLQVWPDDLPLNLFSAEALAAHGKTEQGLEQIRAFVARHPDSLDARMELILLLVKAKRFDEAEKHIGSIAAGERTPMVDYYHARALIGMQRRAEAIPLLQKAIQAMPDFVEALVELAYAYEQQKQWNEARTIYEKQAPGLRAGCMPAPRPPFAASQPAGKGPEIFPQGPGCRGVQAHRHQHVPGKPPLFAGRAAAQGDAGRAGRTA